MRNLLVVFFVCLCSCQQGGIEAAKTARMADYQAAKVEMRKKMVEVMAERKSNGKVMTMEERLEFQLEMDEKLAENFPVHQAKCEILREHLKRRKQTLESLGDGAKSKKQDN